MYEESIAENHLHLCKENLENSLKNRQSNTPLPSGELSISKKGAKLYLRPLSPYRYNLTPEVKESNYSSSSTSSEDEEQFHQRSSTTIINDIAQSYTFFPAIQETDDSLLDEELLSNTSEFEDNLINSIMDSTIFPKQNQEKLHFNQKKTNSIKTLSSIFSTENNCKELLSRRDCKSFDFYENNHSLLESIIVFCEKCEKNNPTEVIENIYIGTL